jgi:hypothetical protein
MYKPNVKAWNLQENAGLTANTIRPWLMDARYPNSAYKSSVWTRSGMNSKESVFVPLVKAQALKWSDHSR